MIPQNLALLLKSTAERFPDKGALFHKKDGKWHSISWREFSGQVDKVASAFLRFGIHAGDRVAILSENRPEWAVADMAAQSLGAPTVPIYTSLAPSEIHYLLSDSQTRLIVVSNQALLEKVMSVAPRLPYLATVVLIEGTAPVLPIRSVSFADLLREAVHPAVIQGLRGVEAGAVASIIYTSGTTGFPKGVMLSHSNLLHNVVFSSTVLKMSGDDAHLSFLPLSHIFERMAGYYLMVYLGASIYYAENMDAVPQNLIEVRPTFVLGVPRFYEKIKDRVTEKITKGGPLAKWFFVFLLRTGVANRKFKERLGGRVRFCVSGGAPLAKAIAEFFKSLGVMIYEGYGLTETSPVISVNRENKWRFGSVGAPLEGIAVRIAEDGEILTSGPCVMKGYHGKPDETREALKDGWFHTGDLGRIDEEGFLFVTGRKKELIVTSGGKKVAPKPIEESIEKDPAVLRCVLFGEGRRFITALIVPREEALRRLTADWNLPNSSYTQLLKNERVLDFFRRRIDECTSELAGFEKIKYFALLDRDFSQEAGELTPTLKVKREAVWARHQYLLLPFYEKDR